MTNSNPDAAPTAASLFREVAGLFRALAAPLLGSALIIFIPFGLLDAVVDPLAQIGDFDTAPTITLAVAGTLASVLLLLLGDVFYAGIVSAMVSAHRRGVDHSWRTALAHLPVARLVVADVLYAFAVIVGLLLLVVPGIVILVRYALVPPAIEIEGRSVIDAFRRSAEIVRPRVWLVGLIVLPLSIGSELLSELVFSEALHLFGESLVGEWAGSVLSELATAPALALLLVVVFLELRVHEASGSRAV